MKLSNIINKELLLIELKSSKTEDVLQEMTLFLKEMHKISDEKEILSKLLEREKLASTSIGKNTAIPHAKIRDITNPIVLIAISKKGFLYNPSDIEPVHLIILVLSPTASPAIHLQILAAAASIIKKQGDIIGELLKVENNTELANVIRNFEEIND